MKYLRFIGIFVGLSLLGYLFHQVGLSLIRQSLGWLGWSYLLVLASALAWDLINTVGFQMAFPKKALKTNFLKLFEIRVVGETFNALLPSGYIGGEPLKVKFLAADMPLHEASSSVLIAKVAQSLSLVLYLILGLTITRSGPSPLRQRAALVSIVLLALGIGIFTFLIARGSFSQLAGFLHRWTRHPWLKRQEERLLALDESLRQFFRHEKGRFLYCLLWHSAGWFVSAMEIPLICYLLGHPISWQAGWFMAAMAQLGSSIALAIPAGIGFFEGGHYLAASLLGLPPFLGLTVGLIRRVRELVWDGIGILLFWHLSKELARTQNSAASGVISSIASSPY
jgi:glycosyltransferase 2 family protein